MKKIIIKNLTECTIDDTTLCGDGMEEYIFEYTKKQITCKPV